ncbi:unnamed protein product, partial [Amoebophrya sp. A25]|eukprot:GSA25T00024376001.1
MRRSASENVVSRYCGRWALPAGYVTSPASNATRASSSPTAPHGNVNNNNVQHTTFEQSSPSENQCTSSAVILGGAASPPTATSSCALPQLRS